MNQDEARRQIEQMVTFILQEAKERAAEIDVKTENDFTIDKQTEVHKGRVKIEDEFARKEKEMEVAQRIAHSQAVGAERTRKMVARDELLAQLLASTKLRLASIADDRDRYARLLQDLIVQGLVKLQEPKVEIRCRAVDADIVRSVFPAAEARYKEVMKAGIGKDVAIKLTLNERSSRNLPPPPTPGAVGLTCSGGIVLSALHGRILCDNTLDTRLDLCFDQLKPVIRSMLFPSSVKTNASAEAAAADAAAPSAASAAAAAAH